MKNIFNKLNNFIKNSPIKSISIFTSLVGGIYLFYFLYFKVKYLPLSSLNNLSILIMLYAFLAIFMATILVFLLIYPAEMAYSDIDSVKKDKFKLKRISNILNKLKNSNKSQTIKKLRKYKLIYLIKTYTLIFSILGLALFFILSLFIVLFYPIITKIVNINNNILFILALLFIIAINFFYYKIRNTSIYKYFILFLFILILFIFINFLSNLISKTLRIGNYHSTLIIKNKTICKQINNSYKNNCKINIIVLWRSPEEYIIEHNNIIYKIPTQDVLMEFFSNSLDKNNS